MTSPDNLLTGLFALNEVNLTASQKNRCLTLYAMQDDPFGMLSQWLYSRSLERENTYSRTISNQQKEIENASAFKESLLSEINKMKALALERDLQTATLEHSLFDEVHKLKSSISGANPMNEKLLNELDKLKNDNKMLRQTLYQAMIEIQKLITRSN